MDEYPIVQNLEEARATITAMHNRMLLMETALELAMHDLNVAQIWASDMKDVISPPDPNEADFTFEQYLTIAKEVLEDQNDPQRGE
jgi:hypothetical protein